MPYAPAQHTTAHVDGTVYASAATPNRNPAVAAAVCCVWMLALAACNVESEPACEDGHCVDAPDAEQDAREGSEPDAVGDAEVQRTECCPLPAYPPECMNGTVDTPESEYQLHYIGGFRWTLEEIAARDGLVLRQDQLENPPTRNPLVFDTEGCRVITRRRLDWRVETPPSERGCPTWVPGERSCSEFPRESGERR